MTERLQVYKCEICGNIVEVLLSEYKRKRQDATVLQNNNSTIRLTLPLLIL